VTIGGAVSGSGTVTQIGSNTVTLSGANAGFAGKLFITNGVLNTTAANGLGGATASVTVTNGGTLDDNGVAFNNTAAPAIVVSGAGYNGAGAIINSGAQQISAFSNITVAASAAFGGNNRWDIRAPSGSAASLNMSPAGSPYSITKVGTNEISLVSVGTIDAGLGNIYVQQGEFAIQLSTAQLGNPASNLVVSAGAFLEMYGATTPLNKVITFNGNGATDSFKSDNSTSSQNVVAGPVTLNGNCLFDISGGAFATFGSVIAGTGGLTTITSGTLTLTNVNTYSGDTVVSNGTLVLSGSGSLASSNILVLAGAVLNAAGRTNQTLTLNGSQTLSGFGTITGAVSSASGSTVAPGSGSTLGMLTVSGNAALAGTSLMMLNESAATNDVLAVGGSLALGGTLNVPNQSGTFTTNDTFRLFTAAGGISGAFNAIVPATPGSGLGWNTNTLTTDGVLRIVASVNATPTNIIATVSGNTLALAWPSDHTGWRLQVQTNAPGTGLNPNPAAWVTVPGSAGTNRESITVDPSQGTVFYRMVYP
jgi:autotransporter-associated beta strand protein